MTRGEVVRTMLEGGERPSIGRANEVATLILDGKVEIKGLIECLFDTDPVIYSRAANALEKVSREKPVLLQKFRSVLMGLMAETHAKEIRWSLALVVPRLRLTGAECAVAAEKLRQYLADESSIVKTFAMTGLVGVAEQRADLRGEVLDIVRRATKTGTAAMRARGRGLLRKLERRADWN